MSLIMLPFVKNPLAPWNGLEIARYFIVASGWILAWLWLIVRPLVNGILPAGRTVGSIMADRVTGFAMRARRQGAPTWTWIANLMCHHGRANCPPAGPKPTCGAGPARANEPAATPCPPSPC
jgi:hypothetical protein